MIISTLILIGQIYLRVVPDINELQNVNKALPPTAFISFP